MSDYLGHLVSRMLSPQASVQPRLPSVFEPVSRADAGREVDVAAGTDLVPIGRRPPAPRRTGEPFHATRAGVDAGLHGTPVLEPSSASEAGDPVVELHAVEARLDAVRPNAEGLSPVAWSRPVRPNAEGLRPVGWSRPVIHPEFGHGPEAPPSNERRTADSAGQKSTATAAPPFNDTNHDQVARTASAATATVFAQLDEPRPALEPPASRPQIGALSAGTRRAQRAHAHSTLVHTDTEAHTAIHVSIGRVEIRAASAPPAPRSAAPASSAMTLGEYLRQRTRGGR